MSVDASQVRGGPEGGEPTTADVLDRLTRFDGPPDRFLPELLAAQCRIAGARAAAILRVGGGGDSRPEVIAAYPALDPGASAPVWLATAAESAGGVLSSTAPAIVPLHESDDLYGHPARRHLVMLPLRSGGMVRGVAAYVVEAADSSVLEAARQRLELTVSLLSLYEMRLTLQRRQADLGRLRQALETLAAVNEQKRFVGAAMAFCNEVASRWSCERVSLGFLKGRYVAVRAMSRTEKFSRKMKVVGDIEAAMEESLDQDVEVICPASAEATFVSRSAKDLSTRHGPTAVASIPMRREGAPVGVLTTERPIDEPFQLDQIESLRLTCDLCTARLAELKEHDRWFGARAASAVRSGLGKLVGPKHTWAKLAAVLILAGVLFLIFAKGDYCAEGSFVIKATQRRVIPAPFDGYLTEVHVKPGDLVKADTTILARLDTAELRLQLASARAERAGFLKQVAAAMRDAKTAEAQIATAQAEKVKARGDLLDYRIAQAAIRAAIDGTVVAGDLKRRIGAPVKTGDVLFEVAPLDSLYAELSIPEDRIADVRLGQEGELATAAYPDRRIRFEVERIDPVAEVVEQQNIFRVRVRLATRPAWLRPGMEGSGRISIEKRTYGWLWTHRLVDWIRMKLWL